MRLMTTVGIVAAMSMGLWSVPARSEEPPEATVQRTAPTVIIFTNGNWHLVTELRLKDGSVIFRKPGETSRAIPDYKVDWTRTGEVNQALRELVDVCRTEKSDLGWIDILEGRSARVFVAACNRTMPECLAWVQDRSQKTEEAARERERRESMAGLEDAATADALNHADRVVMNNTSITATARHADGVTYERNTGHDHLGEYAGRAGLVIAEQCLKEAIVDSPANTQCRDRQTAAVGRLVKRKAGSVFPDAFIGIREHCRRDWPRDYFKRDGCEADEVAAFQALDRLMTDPRISPADLTRIQDHCRRTWVTSYTMQEVCFEESLEALPSRR